ncbi:MAG TPA: Flp pilus assembly protein CpaB [Stellaceae bacterium]|nr:Flp pilus assembly protein CpaB [Stellaceae bacterium]
MRLVSVVIATFALVLAAAIYFVVPRLMTHNAAETQRQQPAKMPTQDVLVAAKDLPAGTILANDDVRWQRWPKDAIAADFLVREKGADVARDVAGHVVLRGIEKDAPITPLRLLKPGTAGFLAAALAPGKYASSIAIGPVPGVSGLVLPGDRVDVLLTEQYAVKLRSPEGGSAPQISNRDVTSVLLHDVRVLAIDQVIRDIDSKPTKPAATATLEVTLDQAEKLALATSLGGLSLTLRSLRHAARPAPASGPDIVQDYQVSPFRAYILKHYYASGTGPKPAAPRDTGRYLMPRIYHGAVLAGPAGRSVPQ